MPGTILSAMKRRFSQCCLTFWLALISCNAVTAADVWQINVRGAIGPATADHMTRGLEAAQEAGADFVLLGIDTPGGLDSSMREMIKAILAANIPVVGYVNPAGARAASAGTYLLYATHVAAMAPGTNLGAATPVQIGSPGLPSPGDKPAQEGQPATAMERKVVNDAVAYLESLAQLRGRNADWADSAVREGASLSAEDALAAHVIDILAVSIDDLLAQLDGREVAMPSGPRVLETVGARLELYPLDWRTEFLAIITNPNVAYVLMLLGIYGLIIEFYNPGVGLPGIVGAVCLLLALYAFQLLPVSYAGVALILLGIALMTTEAFIPSFGVLGLGGLAAFVIGSIMLMDTGLPAYQVAIPLIAAVSVFSALLLIFALGFLLRARSGQLVTGLTHLLGTTATVEAAAPGLLRVRLEGELWDITDARGLNPGDTVIVQGFDELRVTVTRLEED